MGPQTFICNYYFIIIILFYLLVWLFGPCVRSGALPATLPLVDLHLLLSPIHRASVQCDHSDQLIHDLGLTSLR